jgi:hypothetical protein
MDITVGIILALGLAGLAFVAIWKKGAARFWAILAETNKRYGTCFGISSDAKNTIIGVDLYRGGALAFDQTHRKIAYITNHGRSVEILNYDFVQSWRVTWREKTSGGGAHFGMVTIGSASTRQENVFLEITTNDLRRPLIRMPMSSRRYAQETAARLKIMINMRT